LKHRGLCHGRAVLAKQGFLGRADADLLRRRRHDNFPGLRVRKCVAHGAGIFPDHSMWDPDRFRCLRHGDGSAQWKKDNTADSPQVHDPSLVGSGDVSYCDRPGWLHSGAHGPDIRGCGIRQRVLFSGGPAARIGPGICSGCPVHF